MSKANERLCFCLALAAAGTLLLTAAAGLRFSTSAPATRDNDWSDPPPRSSHTPDLTKSRRQSSGLPAWPAAVAGAGLLGSALVLLLRQSGSLGYADPRGARACPRCRHQLGHEAVGNCPKCGTVIRCPQCGHDLAQGGADACQSCGAPWGCRRCGFSLKGLASNPCPSCGAPTLCHGCGADLHHNITGRCTHCGARIAGWREWR